MEIGTFQALQGFKGRQHLLASVVFWGGAGHIASHFVSPVERKAQYKQITINKQMDTKDTPGKNELIHPQSFISVLK